MTPREQIEEVVKEALDTTKPQYSTKPQYTDYLLALSERITSEIRNRALDEWITSHWRRRSDD